MWLRKIASALLTSLWISLLFYLVRDWPFTHKQDLPGALTRWGGYFLPLFLLLLLYGGIASLLTDLILKRWRMPILFRFLPYGFAGILFVAFRPIPSVGNHPLFTHPYPFLILLILLLYGFVEESFRNKAMLLLSETQSLLPPLFLLHTLSILLLLFVLEQESFFRHLSLSGQDPYRLVQSTLSIANPFRPF